jgi:cytidylate kinase
MKLNSPFVITISRQLGSGGAYIGQKLAKNLNIFYADREIISQAAKQFSLLEEDLESRDEKISSFWQSFLQSYAFTNPVAYEPPQIIPTDSALFKAEKEIIEHIAKERSSIIIGRCGSYILREYPNHISIFLHSDVTFRKGRVRKIYNVSEEDARKMIAQSDKERALYYQTFADKEWPDARQYDISLDTSKIGLDKSVELIMKYVE